MENNVPDKKIEMISDKKFLRFIDIRYEEGKHYFAATRREQDKTFAVLDDIEGKFELPDAVTIVFIIKEGNSEPKLFLNYEYRYAAGRSLLSPIAGLIDRDERENALAALKELSEKVKAGIEPEDLALEKYESIVFETLKNAAIREIKEESGYDANNAQFEVLSYLVFSSPGMSDESNAFIKCTLEDDDERLRGDSAPDGSELFYGFELLTKEAAEETLNKGRDKFGNFYSMYTYAALTEFISS